MKIDPAELGAEKAYRLLTGIVVPRPIAWVTSLSQAGTVNLAPFSAFIFVSPKPPMLAISVGRKSGVYKDTARNILDREEYVIHIADSPLMSAVHESSAEHPPEVSEVEVLGLETTPSDHIGVPRLTAAPIAMECRFRQCLEFGDTRSRLIVGEVVAFHIKDDLLANGKIETESLDPIARIAGPRYARLGEIFTLKSVFQTSK
ncbi:NADH-FMN oxidoreductase RutF, flavin reductase (DIM6/NTAB) family [Bradyrhizobium sp. NFR13]|uniref:flavin reductase family protein n=1 Tax=Bradyrhizobium sp. NFR13 TaxID=1566285 RepID=UPI0008EE0827|nr:flavin reductase family protein [Bradyrhizobium sp. NFR13]SFL32802.1 NADH-FMN oxidoreductase RutF, flavin reductase (DIM6/NTAB) family [Bradyrhizobium sp. NFR13]